MLLYHRRDKDPIVSYSMSKKDASTTLPASSPDATFLRTFTSGSNVESMANSYIASQSEIKDSPKELMEKIKTVDSGGAYNETNFGISIKSMPKKDCILPATYNNDTFSCDCPLGSDYIEMYGCKSKCPDWKQYQTDGTCTDHCDYRSNPHQYWNGSSCTDCPVGTKNDGNNHCIPMNPCPDAMGYTDTSPYTCVSSNSCQPYEMSVDGRCYTKCNKEYEIYDVNAGSCVSCYKAGTNYTASQINDGSNNCTAGTYTCKKGEHIDPATGVCVSQCLNYQKFVGFETIAGSCGSSKAICVAKCADNQYYDSYLADCRYCPVGQTSDGKNGCEPVKITPIPTPHCTAGFQLNSDNTRCESRCDYWRYNDDVDPTYCDLLCPSTTQFYDLTLGEDDQKNKINNGCADCPMGWATDNSNQCTICDYEGGYTMKGTECVPSCQYWQDWDQKTNVCDYRCPDHRQYYIDGKGCAYCPVGYLTAPDLSNNCKSKPKTTTDKNDNCDNEKGYVANGLDTNGNFKCVFQCSPWQYWDNTLQVPGCVNHCTVAPNFYYDASHDMCVTCQDMYPAIPSSQLSFDAANNKCIVKPSGGSGGTSAPTPSVPPLSLPTTLPPTSLPPTSLPPTNDKYTVHEHCTFGQNTTPLIPEEDKDKVGPATLLKRTLNEAKDVCNKYSECIGFVRDNSVKDPNTPSNTQFDKIINNATNYNYNDSLQCNSMWSWAVYTKDGTTSVANTQPAPPSQITVVRNNGTVSCDKYCAGYSGMSWWHELPDGSPDNHTWDKMYNWNGAKCVQAFNDDGTSGDCHAIRGYEDKPAKCVCAASGTGWETNPNGKDDTPTCKYADRSSYADDYLNTCTFNSNSNGNISANCRKADGRTVAADINSCDCAGRVQNYDGKLVCNNRSDSQGDDYRNSCTNVDIKAGLISATCDAYGNPNPTSISESCDGRIQNVGGNLVCR